jgi:DinB superfamily
MGAKSETLARQFEDKAREARHTLEELGEADWKKVTAAERWPVGVTAHHMASVLEPISGMIQAVAAGRARGPLTLAMLDEMNAAHARDHADCTRAETLALHDQGVARAAAVIRGLSDEQLARSGTLVTDMPPMTTEQVIRNGLLQHIDEHYDSIRNTVGH